MPYAIETKNLSKYFFKEKGLLEVFKNSFKTTKIPALNGINLKVKYGELYGLLGPNGAGKTTLLKILSSLIIQDSGSAFVNGIDVAKESDLVKYSIGLVYGEERSFYWRLTGRQNLEFYASLYNIPPQKIKEQVDYLFEIVGLKDKADFRFDGYSTGMKHRLALARGLIGNPRILLMDEPTLGIDPMGTEKLQEFIRRLVDQEGKTVILVTHDLNEVVKICDTAAILHKGKLEAEIPNVKQNKPDLLKLFKEYCN